MFDKYNIGHFAVSMIYIQEKTMKMDEQKDSTDVISFFYKTRQYCSRTARRDVQNKTDSRTALSLLGISKFSILLKLPPTACTRFQRVYTQFR